jgi:hypothetical protein
MAHPHVVDRSIGMTGVGTGKGHSNGCVSAMPGEKRVRGDDVGKAQKIFSTDKPAFEGQAAALMIVESKSFPDCSLRTRTSSRRYSMTNCWWRFIQPAMHIRRGKGFMAKSSCQHAYAASSSSNNTRHTCLASARFSSNSGSFEFSDRTGLSVSGNFNRSEALRVLLLCWADVVYFVGGSAANAG